MLTIRIPRQNQTGSPCLMNLSSAHKTLGLITSRYCTCATLLHQPLNLHHFLQLSVTHQSLSLTEQIQAQILTHGLQQNPFLATKLISAYALYENPNRSKFVFHSVHLRSVYLWNSLINGFVKNCFYNEAFELFVEMCNSNVLPDDYTLATMAKVSCEVHDLVAGKYVHGKSIRSGFVMDTVVANSLMSMYCKCGNFGEGRKVFDEMPQRNVGSWNAIIAGCASSLHHGSDKKIWELARCMLINGLKPDGFTLSSLLPLCGGDDVGKWDYGRELHCYIVKYELDLKFGSDVHLGCCLIDMYSKSNRVVLSRRIFDRMRSRNVYAWTAIVNGYVQNAVSDEALVLFHKMQLEDGIQPNRVSLVSVLPACSSHAGLMSGKQIHGFAFRKHINHDASVCNALIDMYAKCGSLESARRVFDDDSFCKDPISWSSMISGYGLHGKGEKAIVLYNKMLQLGMKPDMITLVGLLSACGRSGLVSEGLSIYSSATTEFGMKPTVEICACVVDLLGRSGELDRALKFIKTMPVEPGASVWGALLSASVLHGNLDMKDLAYRFLVQLEPQNPSNYISLSNFYASSGKWDGVAETRTLMKERGLKKAPGCSWISISSKTHCFYVADKAHPRSNSIYEMLDYLILVMKGDCYCDDFEHPHIW